MISKLHIKWLSNNNLVVNYFLAYSGSKTLNIVSTSTNNVSTS